MNKRVFVKKKENFQVEAISLLEDLHSSLHEVGIEKIDLYNIYDIFGASEEDLLLLTKKVLTETVTDEIFYTVDLKNKYIAFENIPGQFDQRADSAEQCLALLNGNSVKIRSGYLVVLHGYIDNLEAIKKHLINPIEMREKNLNILHLPEEKSTIEEEALKGFISFSETALAFFRNRNALAMSEKDLEHIQKYFRGLNRDPLPTEIKVLDTYWSDHCRHTTFQTILEDVTFSEGQLKEEIENTFREYLDIRKKLNIEKEVTLMDLGTIGGKYEKLLGNLNDLEESDENNACSIEIDVDNDGESEKYLLMFKNETHNHPTEIEPFGGASTCIGGAIRDPLSGRAYVYQAMRITGAGDITEDISKTLPNKLPQSVISRGAARGYSSYGNQIGLATTFVKEIYSPGYLAKRMEVGAVVGAVKKSSVKRMKPLPGDLVILIGGGTGRDGVGGATGSSKSSNEKTLKASASEVQKGNAPVERRIQRLMRNPAVTKMIKKANDFGAGGVAVAIGEIARGVEINLDLVPLKYSGLNGSEIALSESQERMAVVIGKNDLRAFMEYVIEENLQGSVVAKVTEEEKLVMIHHGKKIVEIDREFLDTNGVANFAAAEVSSYINKESIGDRFSNLKEMLVSENVATNFGMTEMFDSSIGRGTILSPLGGKYQLSESEASVQKIPTPGFTKTCSILTYGYNPEIFNSNTYLGGMYSVIESLARVVAVGGDYSSVRLSFQEYFEKLSDKKKWGKPLGALLGAMKATTFFHTPVIGGKDSMSGTYLDLHVPPTLISFAVTTEKVENIISSEFKEVGNYIYLIDYPTDENKVPDFVTIKENFQRVRENIHCKKIVSASTVKFGGVAESIVKMALGNKLGAAVLLDSPYSLLPGGLVVESREKLDFGKLIGEVTENEIVKINSEEIDLEAAKYLLESRYKSLYKNSSANLDEYFRKEACGDVKNISLKKKKASVLYDKPKVLITVFPGTNSEYDSEKAFLATGAEVTTFIFNNLNSEKIKESIEKLTMHIDNCQIFMIPGGFSGGDEPDGSGKFIAAILQNESVKNSIRNLLKREGLILGICNGFQALVKCGLLPYGDFDKLHSDSPTLFRNDINRHISKMIETEVISNNSPWLSSFKIGEKHTLPISHGEGKFVIDEKLACELFANNQVATIYGYRSNLNGSNFSIEGITSPCGQIFGKMAHSERFEEGLYKNIPGEKLQDIFTNGVQFFKK